MVQKKENRGGARPNTGPKPTTKSISDKVKNNYEDAAQKIFDETGMTFEEHVLRMAIDKDVMDTCRVACAKLYNEAMIVKTTESHNKNEKVAGPKIGLPPIKKDPAKLVPIKGKKQANSKEGK